MKDDTIVAQPIEIHGGQQRLLYSPPRITVYGDMTELTKALGNAPPTDSETTVSGHVSG
jgi:hypothetical protein